MKQEDKQEKINPIRKGLSNVVKKRRAGRVRLSRKRWDELNEKAELADERLERLQRLQADFDNYRKRIAKEREGLAALAVTDLMQDLLGFMDNCERVLSSARESHDLESLLAGVEMILKQLSGILGKRGLEQIPAAGVPFDPNRHEAIMTVETDDRDGIVVEEVQKGYTLGGRLLRASMVKVGKEREVEKDG